MNLKEPCIQYTKRVLLWKTLETWKFKEQKLIESGTSKRILLTPWFMLLKLTSSFKQLPLPLPLFASFCNPRLYFFPDWIHKETYHLISTGQYLCNPWWNAIAKEMHFNESLQRRCPWCWNVQRLHQLPVPKVFNRSSAASFWCAALLWMPWINVGLF